MREARRKQPHPLGTDSILVRKRLHDLLLGYMENSLVVMTANSGYGKTVTVKDFLDTYQDQFAYVYIPLYKADDDPTRFWETFSDKMGVLNPAVGQALVEIGFPGSEKLFDDYHRLLSGFIMKDKKYIIVLDDYHHLQNKAILDFIRRAAASLFPKVTAVIISRAMWRVQHVNRLTQQHIKYIKEEDLKFSPDEITAYYNQLGIPTTEQGVQEVYASSNDWATGVHSEGQRLLAHGQDGNASVADLATVKGSIASMFAKLSKPLRRFLLRLSLLDTLPDEMLRRLGGDDAMLAEMEAITTFVRYDDDINEDHIHDLFRIFLVTRVTDLSPMERLNTHLAAAKWHDLRNENMKAIPYYAAAGKLESVVRTHIGLSQRLRPETAKLLLDIYEQAVEEELSGILLYPLARANILINLNRLAETIVFADECISKFAHLEPTPWKIRRLVYIAIAKCESLFYSAPERDDYRFAPTFAQLAAFHKLNECVIPEGPRCIMEIGLHFGVVGISRKDAFEEYFANVKEAIRHIAPMMNGYMGGLDILARAEYLYMQGDKLDEVDRLFREGILEAKWNKRYDFMGKAYLYRMRIAFRKKNADGIKAMEKAIHALTKETA
ncbi:MAG: hypothetical protein LBS11_04275 [Oscillospiraceae bacterium]|nr:hypothetical protein [Oscillospiraceae bacterium]